MSIRRLLALLVAPTLATAQGPDFSGVDSIDKALALVAQGRLEKIMLLPHEAGGSDAGPNVVYVPTGIGEVKRKVDGTVLRMAREGLVSRLSVEPAYKGRSVVPSRIVVKGHHPQKAGAFETTIEVW